MPADQWRPGIYLPREAETIAKRIAAQRGMSVNAVFRLALGVLQVHEDARLAGEYVGTTKFREHLDQVIVSPV